MDMAFTQAYLDNLSHEIPNVGNRRKTSHLSVLVSPAASAEKCAVGFRLVSDVKQPHKRPARKIRKWQRELPLERDAHHRLVFQTTRPA